MPFHIVRDDLAHAAADAIVVCANEELVIEGTSGGAVAEVAGREQLQRACDAIGHCYVGKAVLTPAFNASAHHIIHAVGPIWQEGSATAPRLLEKTLMSVFELAWEAGDRSVALPLVSAGTNGFPVREALAIHTKVITDFLNDHEMDITLVLFDRKAVIAGTKLELSIERYIDDVYVQEAMDSSAYWSRPLFDAEFDAEPQRSAEPTASSPRPHQRKRRRFHKPKILRREKATEPGDRATAPLSSAQSSALPLSELENRVAHLDLSFTQTLLHLIDATGRTDAEVYKRANVSRQLFSKIRSDPQYRPSKKTVVAFAVALELSLDETNDLLARAGFALSHSRLFDVIVEFFIEQGSYDVFTINEALYAYDQELLG